jgi:uncharacterized protein YndB with AHSA1/START domain
VSQPLRIEFDLDCGPEHAFRVWTTKLSRWWPADHTVSGEPAEIVLEGHVGGLIFERTADGTVHEWGEITAWEPPRHLAYTWYLRQDRADATQVQITFIDRSPGTRVEIEHHGWERLGAKGHDLRRSNTAGWHGLLPYYRTACADSEMETS